MTLGLKLSLFKFVKDWIVHHVRNIYVQNVLFVDHAIRFNEYKTRNESVYAKYLWAVFKSSGSEQD